MPLQRVLDGGELLVQLGREVGWRDAVVLARKAVAVVADGAHPEGRLCLAVHVAERVQDGLAPAAWHGLVWKGLNVCALLQRGVQAGNGHNLERDKSDGCGEERERGGGR